MPPVFSDPPTALSDEAGCGTTMNENPFCENLPMLGKVKWLLYIPRLKTLQKAGCKFAL